MSYKLLMVSVKSLTGLIRVYNKWGIHDRKCARYSLVKPSPTVDFEIYCPHSALSVHCEWFISLTGEFCRNIQGLHIQSGAHRVPAPYPTSRGNVCKSSGEPQLCPKSCESQRRLRPLLLSSSRQKVHSHFNKLSDNTTNISLFICKHVTDIKGDLYMTPLDCWVTWTVLCTLVQLLVADNECCPVLPQWQF